VFDVIAAPLRGRSARGIAVLARYPRELTAGVAAVCAWRDSSVKPSVIVAEAADLLREAPDVEVLVIALHELSSARGARGDRGGVWCRALDRELRID
jgi:hypothetical protein